MWQQTVIMYIVEESPSIGAITRFVGTNWNFAAKPHIHYHNDSYFMVLFNSFKDKEEVLYSGPYRINSKPIIVRTWNPDFNFGEEVLRTIPLWIRLPNLPINYWGNQMLSRIGSVLGKPLWAALEKLATSINIPWLVMGDFNTMLYIEDRVVVSQVQESEITDFSKFMRTTSLVELKEVIARVWKAKSRWRSLRDDWIKLKRLKYELKILNTKEFQGIEAKISATQTRLLDIQDQMQHPGDHQRLFNLHNGIKEELESWSKVQESAYRLKDCKKNEFFDLAYGDMLVLTDEAKFYALFRYATRLLTTEEERIHLYV
ncbi:hypothetical protein BC332_23567 [Capsicum chinense]|nr:hypothetical protein BC332_23567 [Capsicum chinense]